MKKIALLLALVPLFAHAQAKAPSGGSTVAAPATGAGVDTCTGAGCALGGGGMTSDGGVTLSNGGAFTWTNTGGDWIIVPSSVTNGDWLLKSGSTVYGLWSQSTGRLDSTYGFSVGTSENGGSWLSTGVLNTNGNLHLSAIPTLISTKPALTSFGGTGASITGTGVSFVINVGTGAPGSTGTLTFGTTATNGYSCACYDETASALTVTRVTSNTTTTCVIGNFTVSTGVAANWAASDKVHCVAAPY